MMIKPYFLACCCLYSTLLLSCSNSAAIKRDIIQDADAFTYGGVQAFAEADRHRAKWLFNRALAIYRGIDEQTGQVESHINLAEVSLSERDTFAAQQHLQDARTIANSASLKPHQARITLLYAQTALQQKHYTQAQNFLQLLLPEFENTKAVGAPDIIQLTAIANRTKIAFAQTQNEKLWTHRYANALSVSKQTFSSLTGRLLRFQAKLAQQERNYQQAETLLRQALTEYKKDLARTGIAATLLELGQLHMAQRNWHAARDYLQRTQGVLHALNDRNTLIQVVELLVKVEAKLGNVKSSKALTKWLAGKKGGVERGKHDNLR